MSNELSVPIKGVLNKLSIKDLDIRGKRLFIRVDFNVPLDENHNITDDRRIRSSMATINYAIDEGAKIILASHLGRPKGKPDQRYSLSSGARRLQRLIKKDVTFLPECTGPNTEAAVARMSEGDIVLLENLRFNIEEENPSQILYVTSYQPSNDYYPSPDYSGALPAIDISIEIQNFHKNNLKNGMLPSLFINFNNGVPGPDEQEIITRALDESYGGSDNAGRAVVSFNESKDSGPTIEAIQPGGSDNYYTTIYEDIIRSILSGHRVSSGELFGISTAGKLGSANEILEHSEFFRNTVIKPYINELLGTFNKVMSLKFQEPIVMRVEPLTILDVEKITITQEEPTQE